MKRSFTFSMARKVSTAPYENADILIAESFESDLPEASLVVESQFVMARVKRLVDDLADNLRSP